VGPVGRLPGASVRGHFRRVCIRWKPTVVTVWLPQPEKV